MASANQRLELPGFLLERTAKKMKLAFQRKLKEMDAGITADQWIILDSLQKHDGRSQFEIAKEVFKDAPTLTRIIDILCKKGYTERKINPDDRRRFDVHLTRKGRKKIKQILPAVLEFRQKGWKGLTDKDLKVLRKTLDTVFDNFD